MKTFNFPEPRRIVELKLVDPEWMELAEYRHKIRELNTPYRKSGGSDGGDEPKDWILGIPGHFSFMERIVAIVFVVCIAVLPIATFIAGILGKLK